MDGVLGKFLTLTHQRRAYVDSQPELLELLQPLLDAEPGTVRDLYHNSRFRSVFEDFLERRPKEVREKEKKKILMWLDYKPARSSSADAGGDAVYNRLHANYLSFNHLFRLCDSRLKTNVAYLWPFVSLLFLPFIGLYRYRMGDSEQVGMIANQVQQVFRWWRGWGNIAVENEQGFVMVDQAQMLTYTLLVTKDIFFIVVFIIGYLFVIGTHADGALHNSQRQVVLYTHYEELGVPVVHRPAFWFFLNSTYRHYIEKEQGECMWWLRWSPRCQGQERPTVDFLFRSVEGNAFVYSHLQPPALTEEQRDSGEEVLRWGLVPFIRLCKGDSISGCIRLALKHATAAQSARWIDMSYHELSAVKANRRHLARLHRTDTELLSPGNWDTPLLKHTSTGTVELECTSFAVPQALPFARFVLPLTGWQQEPVQVVAIYSSDMKENAKFYWKGELVENPRQNSQNPIFTLTRFESAVIFMHRSIDRNELENKDSWRVRAADGSLIQIEKIHVLSVPLWSGYVIAGHHLDLLSSVELRARFRNDSSWRALKDHDGLDRNFVFESLGAQTLVIYGVDGGAITHVDRITVKSALEVYWSGGSASPSDPQLQRAWTVWMRNSEKQGQFMKRFLDMEGFAPAAALATRHASLPPTIPPPPLMPTLVEQEVYYLFNTTNSSPFINEHKRRV